LQMSQNMLMGMEASMRDKEVQVAHLMACVYDEQNRTQVRSTNCHATDAVNPWARRCARASHSIAHRSWPSV
jgi:hypothetical protein